MATVTSSSPRRSIARSVYDALLMVGTAARVSHAVRMHRQPDAADLKRLGIERPLAID